MNRRVEDENQENLSKIKTKTQRWKMIKDRKRRGPLPMQKVQRLINTL